MAAREQSCSGLRGMPLAEEEVEELRSERSVKKALKSTEEIERLTVEESLGDVERAVLLLRSGLEVQKICILKSLPVLLQDHPTEDILKTMLPLLKDILQLSSPCSVHQAGAESFTTVISESIVTPYEFSTSFLPIVLSNVESKETDVVKAWLETLVVCISHLPQDVLKREILSTAITKGHLSQSVGSRLACSKILGALSSRFDPYWIKKELLLSVTALCQDVDCEVRASMCQQLEKVARALGWEATKITIIPELVELANDEEARVRLAGLETITNILNLLDDDTCITTIIPLVQKFCNNSLKGDEDSWAVIAKLCGKLCYGLSVNLSEDEKKWFLDFYRKLCNLGEPTEEARQTSLPYEYQGLPLQGLSISDDIPAECRRCCAYNFPALLLFCGPQQFSKELSGCFHSLVADPHVLVRRTIACGFHEVCKLLSTNVNFIQQEFAILLKDEAVEVLQGLIPNLPDSLEALANGGHMSLSDTKMNNLSDLIPSLIACELSVASSSNWRLHVELLRNFSCFPRCLSSDQIYYKFVPLLFRLLSSNRVLPVKLAAAHTLCVFIKHNRRLEQRQELCGRLIQECGRGKSYRCRLLFIDICKYVMELFSRNFFKENFFSALLELSSDPVVNVRLKFCSVLPSLKSVLKLPADRLLLQQLEQCVRKLVKSNKEPDVSAAIREAVLRLDKIEVAMETLSRRTVYEDDLVDQKKEEEEQFLIAMEERDKEELTSVAVRRKSTNKEDRLHGKKSVGRIAKSSKSDLHTSVLNKGLSNKDETGPKPLRPVHRSSSLPGTSLKPGSQHKLTNTSTSSSVSGSTSSTTMSDQQQKSGTGVLKTSKSSSSTKTTSRDRSSSSNPTESRTSSGKVKRLSQVNNNSSKRGSCN